MKRRERQLDERFADWVDGRMSNRDRARLDAELEVNSDLRSRAEEYRRSVETVRRALAEPEGPVGLVDRVCDQIELEGRFGMGKMLPILASVAAAAATILFFFALSGIEPGEQDPVRTAELESEPAGPADELAKVREQAAAPGSAAVSRDKLAAAEQDQPEAGGRSRPSPDAETPPPAGRVGGDAAGAAAAERRLAGAQEERSRQAAPGGGRGATAGVAGPDAQTGTRASIAGEQDRLEVVAEEKRAAPPVAEPGPVADSGAGAFGDALELESWLRQVIGETEVEVEEARRAEVARLRQVEISRLGQGLPPAPEDSAVPMQAPVVVIDLPAGLDLEVGGLGGESPEQGNRSRRVEPPARAENEAPKNRADADQAVDLQSQRLQALLDQTLLPMSNAMPARVKEIDPPGVQTLQGAVGGGLSSRQTDDFRAVAATPAELPQGRGFLVSGEREQVARFLRQMSDWGRAQGGGVGVTQVAETVFQQAQTVFAESAGEIPSVGALVGSPSGARQPGTDDVSVLVLFQSSRKDR